jgi:CubicO group peptidase (beta-lactamase class C family)
MTSGGMSKTRLARLHDRMANHVERGAVPGVLTLIRRRGEVYINSTGTKSLGASEPMRRDTIFRIASMTKPIAAAAAMMLVEECKLRLDDAVERWLPELADRKVLNRVDGSLNDTVVATRPITVRDLLTLRMGFGFIMAPPGSTPIQRAASQLQVWPGPAKPQTLPPPDEWLRRFATLPLLHQPGEKWMYPTGFSVLGILIARASGQPLETFLRERLFEPLGMKDTGFSVPAAKLDRLAACYEVNPESGALELYDGVSDSQWSQTPSFPDAEGGLVSTIDDYLAFGQMMLNQGKHGNERILSQPTVEAMTTNQITPEQKAGSGLFLEENRGWGFGVSTIIRRDDVAAVPGRFGWDGGFGTSWYSDPTEDMAAILMSQVLGFPSRIDLDFWTSVYQAIDD